MTKLEQVEKILQNNTVVHCKNENEVAYLYNLIKDYTTICNRFSFLNVFSAHGGELNICYKIDRECPYNQNIIWSWYFLDYYRKKNCKIIECEDLVMEDKCKEFTKDDLKQGDVILKRNGSVEILVNKTLVRKIGSNILDSIRNDLTSSDGYRFDIIQVRRPLNCTDINFDAFTRRKGELVYDRTTLQKLWNGMTYEQAHRKLWNMLTDDPKLSKKCAINMMNKNGERNPSNNCFACESANLNCQKCPLVDEFQGECLNGIFEKYIRVTGFEKASYAKQIAELPWVEK